MTRTDHTWIDDASALNDAVQALLAAPCVALDTEFERTRTFYPRPALLQIRGDTDVFLIDPTEIEDFSALARLFESGHDKVMHSASEDLELFSLLCADLPQPLFDTQIAAALAGVGYSIGYAALVEQLLSTSLPKSETRSDWLQRPLSTAQLHYAADDVRYLEALYETLYDRLERQDRLSWLREDCQTMLLNQRHLTDEDQQYLRIKGIGRFSALELARLQALCTWREQQARQHDRPRSFIIKDDILRALSCADVRSERDIADIPGVQGGFLRRHGDHMLNLLEEVEQQEPAAWPPLQPEPLGPAANRAFKEIRKKVASRAQELAMPVEILASRRDVERVFRDGWPEADADTMAGWRRDVLHDCVGETAPGGML